MKAKLFRRIGGMVLGSALCLLTTSAMAGMVTSDNAAGQNQTAMERARIQSYLDRAEVKDRLQALGVGAPLAKDRVAAMTDQEVHALAQKIDSMPAGGSLSNHDLTVILLVVLVLLLI